MSWKLSRWVMYFPINDSKNNLIKLLHHNFSIDINCQRTNRLLGFGAWYLHSCFLKLLPFYDQQEKYSSRKIIRTINWLEQRTTRYDVLCRKNMELYYIIGITHQIIQSRYEICVHCIFFRKKITAILHGPPCSSSSLYYSWNLFI